MRDSFVVQVLYSLSNARDNFSYILQCEECSQIFLEIFLEVAFLTELKNQIVVIASLEGLM